MEEIMSLTIDMCTGKSPVQMSVAEREPKSKILLHAIPKRVRLSEAVLERRSDEARFREVRSDHAP